MRGIIMNMIKIHKKDGNKNLLLKDLAKNKTLYLMLLPVIAYYIIFCYYPMYGAQIAFRDYSPTLGMVKSPWVGLKHFNSFFESIFFSRLIKNTLMINLQNLVFGFPAPIILALMLNEVRNSKFKKTIQTISYLPHFISTVIIAGMILQFTATDGVITQLFTLFGYPQKNLLLDKNLFQPIYVASDIWQGIGWGSIIYIAALLNISPELYESATIDGAGRWRQMLNITIPGIAPTVIVMLILRIGNMMSLGFDKVFLLYNPSIYETADVISTYVYRKGLLDMNFSFSTAVGLFNSLVNLVLLVSVNSISRKVNESSLW